MGKIYVIMGKSASGKDSIYAQILRNYPDTLKKCIIYTTRPMRSNETSGEEYFFKNDAEYEDALLSGKMIEHRTYNTVFGPWHYYTMDDGQFDDYRDCLMLGTIESFTNLKKYFGEERVIPLYIQVDDYERLLRALNREHSQENPGYVEMCRRFVADSEDFSEEKIFAANINKRFVNDDLNKCVKEIINYIRNGEGNEGKKK